MSTAIVPYDHQVRLAAAFAKSGILGIKTAEQALTLMAICEAEGLHPAIAARDYHIIDGKPALKADAMMARFQRAGGRVQWTELSDMRVAAVFSHPSGGDAAIDWDMDRAKRAGFAGKNNWQKFPRQMLRARVISEGIRTVFPGVVVGVYTPEEVQDFAPINATAIDVESAPVEAVGDPEPAPQTLPKGASRDLYSELQADITAADSEDALSIWFARRKADIETLPNDWKASLRKQYAERLTDLKYGPETYAAE